MEKQKLIEKWEKELANFYTELSKATTDKDVYTISGQISALTTCISDLKGIEESEWISMKDRLPEEIGRYWCYVVEVNDLGISGYQWNCAYNPNDTSKWTSNALTMHVTHWMPLPSPPKQ